MIVVSDTSPIHYLILVRAASVLPTLFGKVHIPPTVIAELSHSKTPKPVREWCRSLPAWVTVQTPLSVETIDRLDAGEMEAIALAVELNADRFLVDDNAGKRAAKRLGVTAIGTLAILDLAGKRGLIDFRATLKRLEDSTNFRMSPKLRDQLLDEHR